jgi:hypothetical protein
VPLCCWVICAVQDHSCKALQSLEAVAADMLCVRVTEVTKEIYCLYEELQLCRTNASTTATQTADHGLFMEMALYPDWGSSRRSRASAFVSRLIRLYVTSRMVLL